MTVSHELETMSVGGRHWRSNISHIGSDFGFLGSEMCGRLKEGIAGRIERTSNA